MFSGNQEVFSRSATIETVNQFRSHDFATRFQDHPDRYTPLELDRSAEQVQFVWWDPAWVPIASDSCGNLVCVDLHPAKNGVRGQIIGWEARMGPVGPFASNLAEYLESHVEEYNSEDYGFSSDDGIYECS